MRNWTRFLAGLVAGGFVLSATAALADEIRVGITMRMVSENGQKYGQMVMDEIGLINEAGGINGHQIKATLMNDCLLYTSPSPRDLSTSRMPSSA